MKFVVIVMLTISFSFASWSENLTNTDRVRNHIQSTFDVLLGRDPDYAEKFLFCTLYVHNGLKGNSWSGRFNCSGTDFSQKVMFNKFFDELQLSTGAYTVLEDDLITGAGAYAVSKGLAIVQPCLRTHLEANKKYPNNTRLKVECMFQKLN